jgi:hypothetical protein
LCCCWDVSSSSLFLPEKIHHSRTRSGRPAGGDCAAGAEKSMGWEVNFDMTLRDPLMLAFFATSV